MSNFFVRIFTPAGLQREEEADSAIIPTSLGEIDILPGHASYTSILGTGILELQSQGKLSDVFIVSGGFCNFAGDTLTVLADEILSRDSIEDKDYGKYREEGLKKLAQFGPEDPRRVEAERELQKIEAMNRLLGH